MNKMKLLLVLLTPVLVTGCSTSRVLTASENSIAIDHSGTGLTAKKMLSVGTSMANSHCAKYGQKASLDNTTGPLGAPIINYFSCK